MCILIATSAHEKYSAILISNRDELFNRRTLPVHWHPNQFILSPLDTSLSSESAEVKPGTWCGVNKAGKVAVVLNLNPKEKDASKFDIKHDPAKVCSRGALPFMFLSSSNPAFDEWSTYEKFRDQYPTIEDMGPFNLLYGDFEHGSYRIIDSLGQTTSVLTNDKPYQVITNDVVNPEDKWPKVGNAEALVQKLVRDSANDAKDTLIEKCFELASNCSHDKGPVAKNKELTSKHIFIPPLVSAIDDLAKEYSETQFYGTRSQIVILVSRQSKEVTFVERTIYTSDHDVGKYSSESPKEIHQFAFPLEGSS